jgi:hypothetical protein
MKNTYKDHTITLTGDFEFLVKGPAFEEARRYKSMDDARKAVDAAVGVMAKKQKIDKSLRLAVVTPLGQQCDITGIHPRNRTLNGIVGEHRNVYPAVPWIVALCEERGEHKARVDKIDELLRSYEIGHRIGGYGLLSSDTYEEAVNELRRDYSALTKKAVKQGGVS